MSSRLNFVSNRLGGTQKPSNDLAMLAERSLRASVLIAKKIAFSRKISLRTFLLEKHEKIPFADSWRDDIDFSDGGQASFGDLRHR